jgi:hypothetical protein
MTTKSRSLMHTEHVETSAEWVEIPSGTHPQLVLYRAKRTTVYKSSGLNGKSLKHRRKEQEFRGMCELRFLKDFLRNKNRSVPSYVSCMRDGNSSAIMVAKKGHLEDYRRRGHVTFNQYEENESSIATRWAARELEDPLAAHEAGEPYEVWEDYQYAHMAFDLDGNPLPVAVYFDYIGAGINAPEYDLAEVAKVLEARDDIEFVPPRRVWDRLYRKATDHTRHIVTIPHYNSDAGHSTLQFVWAPDAVTYAKVLKNAKSSSSMSRVAMSMDVFGVNKFKNS